MRFLERGMRGWERVWSEIRQRYGDHACEHPICHEVWQYMGTTGTNGDGWHEFRHRALPAELRDRAVAREVYGALIRPGDCGGWRVYDKVRVEAHDFALAQTAP